MSIAKFSLLPAKVNEFHEDFNMMTKDLLRNIRQRRHHKSKTLTDAAGLFYKWSFESTQRRQRFDCMLTLMYSLEGGALL